MAAQARRVVPKIPVMILAKSDDSGAVTAPALAASPACLAWMMASLRLLLAAAKSFHRAWAMVSATLANVEA